MENGDKIINEMATIHKIKLDYSLNESVSLVDRNHYQTPLAYRYGSEDMSYNFSDLKKFSIWRWLWVYLAKAQKELGIQITDEMINEMQEHIEDIDFDFIEEEERQHSHDVLAHINEFSSKCPKSAHIIHLGATSCFVGDNTDLIVIRDAFDIILPKLASCIERLSHQAKQYAALPTVGYTHLQPAGLVTMGKRFCLWINDLVMDLKAIQRVRNELKFHGCKSNLGTQSSFLNLFQGDKEKVRKLDERVTQLAGFRQSYSICGQTYSRKVDCECLTVLANFGVTVHKMCTDIRLLCSFGQLDEPDVESSNALINGGDLCATAVAGPSGTTAGQHKRNPLKSERCCSFARHLTSLASTAWQTAAVQWMERTMDDSAVRRITIPEAFLTADAILHALLGICSGLIVRPQVVNIKVRQEMPYLVTGRMVELATQFGLDDEQVRLRLKSLQREATILLKEKGQQIDLEQQIRSDELFVSFKDHFDEIFNPDNYIGCAVEQVTQFLSDEVEQLIKQFSP